MPGSGNTWQIDGTKTVAQQVVNQAQCGRGACVVIANISPADDLYYSSNQLLLNSAKSSGQVAGVQLLAGEKNVIPWVTSPIYVINFNSGSTPNDFVSVESWE